VRLSQSIAALPPALSLRNDESLQPPTHWMRIAVPWTTILVCAARQAPCNRRSKTMFGSPMVSLLCLMDNRDNPHKAEEICEGD
jgi:hypothetical protein